MSELGHLQAFLAGLAMSALAHEADVSEPILHVGYGPKAKVGGDELINDWRHSAG